RVLQEGDEVAGFRVLRAPGHTPGHICLFREEDRVAIVGDVLNGMNLATTWPGLHEPPPFFCTDVAENRRSILRLAELNPRLLCFGHGPPLRDMEKFDRFLQRLFGSHSASCGVERKLGVSRVIAAVDPPDTSPDRDATSQESI